MILLSFSLLTLSNHSPGSRGEQHSTIMLFYAGCAAHEGFLMYQKQALLHAAAGSYLCKAGTSTLNCHWNVLMSAQDDETPVHSTRDAFRLVYLV